jgi:hypothetical protein
MLATPRNARLLHTIVAMGVALTGGTLGTGCGGSTLASPLTLDAGTTHDGDALDAYPTIGIRTPDGAYPGIHADTSPLSDAYGIILPAPPPDASTTDDGYPTISFSEGDAGDDAYPTIGIYEGDAAVDAYPTIEPAFDAGADAYPIIQPAPPGGH